MTGKHGCIILLFSVAALTAGCSDTITSPEADASRTEVTTDADKKNGFGRSMRGVTVPFKARFYTMGGIDPTDPSCGAPPIFRNVQNGEGKATHLGRSDIHITFCNDATDALDDGDLTEGERVPYDRGTGTFTAANGDELWITIAGAVLPSDHPDFDFEFADPFEIVGGTGRFEGATGHGVTDSYVDRQAGRTEHYWSGKLTLRR